MDIKYLFPKIIVKNTGDGKVRDKRGRQKKTAAKARGFDLSNTHSRPPRNLFITDEAVLEIRNAVLRAGIAKKLAEKFHTTENTVMGIYRGTTRVKGPYPETQRLKSSKQLG